MTARRLLRRLIIWAMTDPESVANERRLNAWLSYIQAWKAERARAGEERGGMN